MADSPDPAPPAARLRLLYRLYEYLRDTDLGAVSGTSRLLHAPDAGGLRARLSDELVELAGVAAGTHRHRGLPDDAILEASQVCYWTFLTAVATRMLYADLDAEACLATAPILPPQAAALGSILAAGIRSGVGWIPAADLRAALRQVGLTLAGLGLAPSTAVEFDLAQMQTRPYLATFFAGESPGR